MTALALIGLLSTAAAQDGTSQGFEASGFNYTPHDGDLEDFLEVWRPEAQDAGSVGISGMLGYHNEPLMRVYHYWDGSEEKEPMLNNLVGTNLGLHVGVHKHIAIGANMPVWFLSSSQDGGTQGPTLGDLRLSVPIGIIVGDQEEFGREGFGLSLVPQLDLPTGDEERFLGSGGVGGGGVLALSYGAGPLLIAANAGAMFTPSAEYTDINGPQRLMFGLASSLRLSDKFALHLEGTVEPPGGSELRKEIATPGEVTLSGRGRSGRGLSWTAGGAVGLGSGPTAAAFRLFAGMGYVFGKETRLDLDGDGISGRADLCPAELEVVNGYMDDDGCADELSTLNVLARHPSGAPAVGVPVYVNGELAGRANSVGRYVLRDQVPGTVYDIAVGPSPGRLGLGEASVSGHQVAEGESSIELDMPYLYGEVVVRVADENGPHPASVSFRGPVRVDDLVIDETGVGRKELPGGSWDLFIESPGMAVERRQVEVAADAAEPVDLPITVREAAVQTTGDELVLLQSVEFASGTADLTEASLVLLSEVASNVLRHDEVRLIEVQGHTDSQGREDANLTLSRDRVRSVIRELVAMGVDPRAMRGLGVGEACPIDTNATSAGRARNRRVQFFIADPAPSQPIPCHEEAGIR